MVWGLPKQGVVTLTLFQSYCHKIQWYDTALNDELYYEVKEVLGYASSLFGGPASPPPPKKKKISPGYGPAAGIIPVTQSHKI